MKAKKLAKTLLSTVNGSVGDLHPKQKTKVLDRLHKQLGRQLRKEAAPQPIGFKFPSR